MIQTNDTRPPVTLPAHIAGQLLSQLIQQRAKPGDLLPAESKLAQQFGVSRPILREALKQLAGQGFVEVVNGRGTLVRALDASQLRAYFTHAVSIQRVPFRELMEARRPLEVQSARLAAQHRTPEHLDEMRGIIQRMSRNIANADVYVDLDRELHALIADASGNTVIGDLITSIRGALNEVTHNTLYRRRNRQQLERVHLLHESIVNDIGYGNAEAAGRAMDIHFGEALQFLIARNEGARK